MPEVIVTIESTEEKTGQRDDGTTWKRKAVKAGGHTYSFFVGQLDDASEKVLESGQTVKITYDQKDKYRNITKAEAVAASAVPAAPQPPNGDDRWQRKDEMSARQTACNCAATIVAAMLGAVPTGSTPLFDKNAFYQDIEEIAHYIITGERPESIAIQKPTKDENRIGPCPYCGMNHLIGPNFQGCPVNPHAPRPSPTLDRADAMFDHPPTTTGQAPEPTPPKMLIDLARQYGYAVAHLQNAVKMAYPDRLYGNLTVDEQMDVMRRCAIGHWASTHGLTGDSAKSCLGYIFNGDAEKPMSAWQLAAQQVSFLYDAHKGRDDKEWTDWFAGQAADDWAKQAAG